MADPAKLWAAVAKADAEAAGAAAICAWAERQGVDVARAWRTTPKCAELLSRADGRHQAHMSAFSDISTVKDVERVFELCLDAEHKRQAGAVYTPDFIIDYLIDEAVRLRRDQEASNTPPVLLDPAVGSGGFLVRGATLLARQTGLPLDSVIAELVCGVDVDAQAVTQATALLELLLLQHGLKPVAARERVVTADALLSTTESLGSCFGKAAGFDVVATNPPYVKLQTLGVEYRASLLEAYGPLAQGNFSLAMLFIVRCHQLLSSHGVAALITQNNLYTSLAAQGLRAHLQHSRALARIVDFGDYRVFEEASAYTCLLFLGARPRKSFEYGTPDLVPSAESLRNVRLDVLSTAKLDSKKWRLGRPADLDNLGRLESVGTPLGALAEIKVGFATLKDKVYFLSADAVGTTPDGETIVIESDVTRPALKVADLDAEVDIDRHRRMILFPYEGRGGTLRPLTEEGLKHSYPAAYEYLSSWKSELQGRDKGKGAGKGANWFEWSRRQSMEAPGPKLLTKTFSSRPHFFLDPSDSLFCNGYSVRPRELLWPLDLRTLQILLESDVMDYYAHMTSFQIGGGYQCYQKNFIERFCIPTLDDVMGHDIRAAAGESRQRLIAQLYGISWSDIRRVLDKEWLSA